MTTSEMKSFVIDLENKKIAYDAALSSYQTTKNTYLNLTRKFKNMENSVIDPINNYLYKTHADSDASCNDICVQDTSCAAASYNLNDTKCAIYTSYTGINDLSGNYAIVPDTNENKQEIYDIKQQFNMQHNDLNDRCNNLIALLKDNKYKSFNGEQSNENKMFLKNLTDKQNNLQKDRALIDGIMSEPGVLDELFQANENVKKSKITANQNFYIQIILGVITVVAIYAVIYYLWPSVAVPAVLSNSYSNLSSNGSLPSYVKQGGGGGLSNQSYFVIGSIFLFSVIVSQLRM